MAQIDLKAFLCIFVGTLSCLAQTSSPWREARTTRPDRAITFDSGRDAIIPQVVDGGGWQTSIILMNPGSKALEANVFFFGDNGKALQLPIRHLDGQRFSYLGGPIPAGGSVAVDTSDIDSTTVQGYAIVFADDEASLLTGVAVFRQRVPG